VDGPGEGAKMTKWKFIRSFCDGERFEFVPGRDIWDYEWKSVLRDPPPPLTGDDWKDTAASFEIARVIDPQYGVEKQFRVYEIAIDGRVIRFAASEFSNNVWGYYLPDESQS
jgi:hypothetical protein